MAQFHNTVCNALIFSNSDNKLLFKHYLCENYVKIADKPIFYLPILLAKLMKDLIKNLSKKDSVTMNIMTTVNRKVQYTVRVKISVPLLVSFECVNLMKYGGWREIDVGFSNSRNRYRNSHQ